MGETSFYVAGAELDWPIGSSPGLTNHPDIEVVAHRTENLVSSGVSYVVGGSWTLGEPRGGSAHVQTETGAWEYKGGDEYVDLVARAGYNAKSLPSPGTDVGMGRLDDLVDLAASRNVEYALSFSPSSGQPIEELKEFVSLAAQALAKKVLYVELNLSCPNVPDHPPFYQDIDSLVQFYDHLLTVGPMLNKYGQPGVRLKYGPYDMPVLEPRAYGSQLSGVIGGRITSNTLGNQVPLNPEGGQAITVNNGKAGMSGPALKELGRRQLELWAGRGEEVISVLGVDSGSEVKARLDRRAAAVQLGSVLYWPELIGCESAGEVMEKIKQEFVEAA